MAMRPQGDDLEFHTGRGEIVVEGGSVERMRLHTGAGNLRWTDIEHVGRLDMHTGMGNLAVEGGTIGRLHMKSGAGNLECAAALGPAEHEMETGTGNIEVRLADNAGIRVDAVTRMGNVRSDFGLVKVGRPGPVTIGSGRFVGTIGTGEATAMLNLKTGAGNISIVHDAGVRPSTTPNPVRSQPAADSVHLHPHLHRRRRRRARGSRSCTVCSVEKLQSRRQWLYSDRSSSFAQPTSHN